MGHPGHEEAEPLARRLALRAGFLDQPNARKIHASPIPRLGGLAMYGAFVLALAHFSILHFVYDPGAQTADFIASQRWNQFFWRAFDWLLLMNVLFHGFLGVRTVVLDYIHRPAWRDFTMLLLYTTAVLLFIIGTQVILTLPSGTAS